AGAPPPRVIPGDVDALPWLMDVPVAVDVTGQHVYGPLDVDDLGIDTRRVPAGGCVNYIVDVESAAEAIDRHALAAVHGRSVLLSPDVWLWRPSTWPRSDDDRARLEVVDDGDGLSLALPFAAHREGGVVVTASTWRLQSWGLVGRLQRHAITRAGTTLTVHRAAHGDGRLADATLDRWLEVAVDDVASSGAFPVAAINVVVVDDGDDDARPIRVGFLGRGGGAGMVLHVGAAPKNDDDDDDDDTGRWVLTHELSHLLLPPIDQRDGWLNEGAATWMQEVLPAQAGRRDVVVAAGNLQRGLQTGAARALDDGFTLERSCAEMHARRSYQHCYWGGAALLTLLARDVGDDGVIALLRALPGPVDGPPQRATAVLQAARTSSDPRVARAATTLLALWTQSAQAPFPTAALSSSSNSGDIGGFAWPASDDGVDR
ncbi:MAG TPA: hypothetical protein VGF99_12760, partial [Myxococcota bacterium]